MWLGLKSREQLMSPECSKHQILSLAKMLVVNEQKISCSHQCSPVFISVALNKFRAYISTCTCFVLPRTHQCGLSGWLYNIMYIFKKVVYFSKMYRHNSRWYEENLGLHCFNSMNGVKVENSSNIFGEILATVRSYNKCNTKYHLLGILYKHHLKYNINSLKSSSDFLINFS